MEIQALKIYLKSNKITYEQLSERSGIPLNTLKNIFSGRTPNPRIDTMQAIEAALCLNTRDISFTDEEKAVGIGTHGTSLSDEEWEIIELFSELKRVKGEATARAIKTMIKSILNEKN
ncbi:MAG: helix-turn-helix transcriptional regulator [Clostridia bacterium]|nr:helix-turn-helix transcriptional regulator [Clostridia bacterium]MBQ8428606.1 helix-turn-helix transcriptional regulator [Clostridia bacterium]